MNILIVTQYFWPENFKINEVAIYLKEKGHKVTVLTGKPNYPEGKFYNGYSFLKPPSEFYNGIEIFRLPTIPRGKNNALKLILNYLFFPFIGRIVWSRMLKDKSFDIIFVCQLSPVFVGLLGARIKKKLKVPMVMWVLDLWPDSIFAASRIKPFFIEKTLKLIVNRIYHSCDKIFVSSKPFYKSIVKYNYLEKNIFHIPNWADDDVNTLTSKEIEKLPILSKGFNILFAGNIGDAQDIDTILNSFEHLKSINDIKMIFIGDGRKRSWLENQIIERNLTNQVFWLGSFPSNTMQYFYNNASVLLASLKPNPVFELTVPAKIQSYMANKKPILSMLSGAGNDIVDEANCGIIVKSGDTESLVKAIKKLHNLTFDELESMGLRGYYYYLENFEKTKILTRLETLLINELKKS